MLLPCASRWTHVGLSFGEAEPGHKFVAAGVDAVGVADFDWRVRPGFRLGFDRGDGLVEPKVADGEQGVQHNAPEHQGHHAPGCRPRVGGERGDHEAELGPTSIAVK